MILYYKKMLTFKKIKNLKNHTNINNNIKKCHSYKFILVFC